MVRVWNWEKYQFQPLVSTLVLVTTTSGPTSSVSRSCTSKNFLHSYYKWLYPVRFCAWHTVCLITVLPRMSATPTDWEVEMLSITPLTERPDIQEDKTGLCYRKAQGIKYHLHRWNNNEHYKERSLTLAGRLYGSAVLTSLSEAKVCVTHYELT